MHNWTKPGGCKEQFKACQDVLKDHDPVCMLHKGKNLTELCDGISLQCKGGAIELYQNIDGARGWYDISHPKADPFPPPHMHGYMLEESVLSFFSVPLNFSYYSPVVSAMFQNTFDITHGGFLDSIADLLDSGVKVHMIYGGRDYACNWICGEKASLAIPYSRADEFAGAGYVHLQTVDGVKGMTRQLGNYSFTRVFQAVHEVPRYEPIAAYEIFMRATFNRDISTGLVPVTDDHATRGVSDTRNIGNIPPEIPKGRCYILKPNSCTLEELEKVKAGNLTVKDWWFVNESEQPAFLQRPSEGGQEVLGEL